MSEEAEAACDTDSLDVLSVAVREVVPATTSDKMTNDDSWDEGSVCESANCA